MSTTRRTYTLANRSKDAIKSTKLGFLLWRGSPVSKEPPNFLDMKSQLRSPLLGNHFRYDLRQNLTKSSRSLNRQRILRLLNHGEGLWIDLYLISHKYLQKTNKNLWKQIKNFCSDFQRDLLALKECFQIKSKNQYQLEFSLEYQAIIFEANHQMSNLLKRICNFSENQNFIYAFQFDEILVIHYINIKLGSMCIYASIQQKCSHPQCILVMSIYAKNSRTVQNYFDQFGRGTLKKKAQLPHSNPQDQQAAAIDESPTPPSVRVSERNDGNANALSIAQLAQSFKMLTQQISIIKQKQQHMLEILMALSQKN